MPKLMHIHTVLVIGSGPIVIGQAAEFDYAGTQACLALREEGIEVVLVNNNPATIMTDPHIADRVYLEPLTLESLAAIIEKERPDGLLPTLGGQTGLNLAVELSEAGVLARYGVELLGTPLDTIRKGEDREVFKAMMKTIDEPVPESITTGAVEEAVRFAATAGYPVIIRPAYTLGGSGGGIAKDEAELKKIVKTGLHASPISQVLVDQSVKGWKELEYEVMRDANDTCIIVCNMENLDPVGVHTGDSIVVAPSQTLNDRQYQMLRTASLKVIRELGVIGGCNIQFALDPASDDYVIIEVNPRVSRSSALASKATGYPIARIAAKLALGYHLDEVPNPITGHTYASFEPAIDYIAFKIPRWPFDKFSRANRLLGTQMKATGEVMALARNFPAALNKAVRSLEIGTDSLHLPALAAYTDDELTRALTEATDERLFAVAEAFRRGRSVVELHELTEITPYFLHEIADMIGLEMDFRGRDWLSVTVTELKHAKQQGFPDRLLADLFGVTEEDVRERFRQSALRPAYKMVDTCAAEFSAETPYFYSAWNGFDEVEPLGAGRKMIVLGSGPIRIGQGVEFDYCSVHAAMSLKEQGIKAVVINNNPETVSTDFNTADHLYFEPLTEEDVLHIARKEQADGVLVQFGGQTAINLAEGLSKAGLAVSGTALSAIEAVEDRERFYRLLRDLAIPHIPGETVMALTEAEQAAEKIGYPVLIRPSYVIGGQGMAIIRERAELLAYVHHLQQEARGTRIFPLLIDRFVTGFEAEVDVVCDGKDILIPGIFEHVEKAGVHSGDSIAVFPAPNVTEQQKKTITEYTQRLSEALDLKGIINIQFVISEDRSELYVLEVNPRASRTVPITSKVTGVPLVDLATRVQMGQPLSGLGWKLGLHEAHSFTAVKMPVFSTNKLSGVDPFLGPEMQSTGEAIGLGTTVEAAMAKAFGWKADQIFQLAADRRIFLSAGDRLPDELIRLIAGLPAAVTADADTAAALQLAGIPVEAVMGMEEAGAACLAGSFSLIGDFHSSAGPDAHRQLRVEALKTDTICHSSPETLVAFLKAAMNEGEAPRTITEYLAADKGLNKTKEEMAK